jgi:hypothetical protein
VELDDGLLLLGGEGTAPDVRTQVVRPPQPAALAAPVQPCMQRDTSPMRFKQQNLCAMEMGDNGNFRVPKKALLNEIL